MSWHTSSRAYRYRLQVSRNSNFSDLEVNFNSVGWTWYCRTFTEGSHYWRVQASDRAGNLASWSPIRKFTIDTTPTNTPIKISPASGTYTRDTTPSISKHYKLNHIRYVKLLEKLEYLKKKTFCKNNDTLNILTLVLRYHIEKTNLRKKSC